MVKEGKEDEDERMKTLATEMCGMLKLESSRDEVRTCTGGYVSLSEGDRKVEKTNHEEDPVRTAKTARNERELARRSSSSLTPDAHPSRRKSETHDNPNQANNTLTKL
jgi:hypothetical protein